MVWASPGRSLSLSRGHAAPPIRPALSPGMTRHITLHHAFDPAAPDWLHLVPAGIFSGADGRGPFSLQDADAVIVESMKAGKLPLDENHATDFAAPEGRPSPARGWIVGMEARDDGIWGRVEWNAAGKALIDDKAYRGISPVLVSDAKSGAVLKVLRASLTNDPNLNLKTLHASDRSTDMDLAPIRAALGLKDDADAAAITEAVKTLHAKAEASSATLSKISAAAGLAEAAVDADKVVAAVKTLHAAKAEAGEAAQLRLTVTTLQTQVDTMSAERAKERATAFVDQAIKDGKPIRSMRDHYIARHAKSPAEVEKEINALVSIHAGGVTVPPTPGAGSADGASVEDITAKATAHQKDMAAKGMTVTYSQAVRAVTAA
jgi:phage I-like protein